jgi:hypothetical protein
MPVEWYAERLNAGIAKAYENSMVVALGEAQAAAPSSLAGAELIGNALKATGIGPVFEEGRRGGYEIKPKDALALKFPSGTFAEFATGGAMAPEPYIWPTAVRWANETFPTVARAELAAQGF